jgi:hypothetical protein
MRYFSVKNFEHHQHYKQVDRPAWIKLYARVLDDFEFSELPDRSKAHLLLIWSLASQMKNRIPYDERWVGSRIRATEPVNLEALEQAGFIVLEQSEDDAGGSSRAEPETALDQNPKSPSDLISSSLLSPIACPDPDPEQPVVVTPTRRARPKPEVPEDFAAFWAGYPRKDGKQLAAESWARLSAEERRLAAEDVPRRVAANWAGRELEHIPHAATYLNQRRWLDGIEPRARLPDPRPRFSPGMERLAQAYREAQARERNGSHQVADEGKSSVVETTGRRTGPS